MRFFLFFIALYCSLITFSQKPYSVQMAESQARNLFSSEWNSSSGMLAYSIAALAEQYPEEKSLYEVAKSHIDSLILESGEIKNFQKGKLEQILPGKAILKFWENENTENKEKYKKCSDWLHSYLVMSYPRIKKNIAKTGFLHEEFYPNQMWLEDLYASSAFYAQWQEKFDSGNRAAWSDIAVQFLLFQKQAYNDIMQLTYPYWSADPQDINSFWAVKKGIYSGTAQLFTSLSTGYLFAALIETMEAMPKDMAGYNQLKTYLNQIAEGVIAWQDEASGCWYQLINYDSSKTGECGSANYLESTSSSLLTYGLLKGVRTGLLDADKYKSKAEKAYNGLISTFISEKDGNLTLKDATGNIGVGNSSSMDKDGTIEYYLCSPDAIKHDNDIKAISAFILASLEYERINK